MKMEQSAAAVTLPFLTGSFWPQLKILHQELFHSAAEVDGHLMLQPPGSIIHSESFDFYLWILKR